MDKELQEELIDWEKELYEHNMKRMYKVEKNYRNPRKKVLEDYRHHRSTKWFYHHECQEVRKLTKRKFRRKLKREINNEVYYKVVPHDYKTYGWITW